MRGFSHAYHKLPQISQIGKPFPSSTILEIIRMSSFLAHTTDKEPSSLPEVNVYQSPDTTPDVKFSALVCQIYEINHRILKLVLIG